MENKTCRSFLCRSFLLVISILCLTLVAPLKGYSATYETDMTFVTEDQSMWGAGDAIVYDYDYFLGVDWNESGGFGGIENVTTPEVTIVPEICVPILGCTPAVTIPAANLGDYGLEVTGSTNGQIGFELDVALDSGSVDVAYPVGVSIDYPDPNETKPGDTFTISTSFDADPTASMITNFPEASLSLDFIFDVYAYAYGELCVVDCVSGNFFYLNVDETIPLIDLDSNTTEVEWDLGVSTIKAQVPDINTTGTLGTGDSIDPEAEEDWLLDLSVDVDLIATTLLTLPPLGGGADLGIASISYDILNVAIGALLNVTQDFLFEPTLMVELDLGNGQSVDLEVGESIDLQMPDDWSSVEITPTFYLDNTFTNETGLSLDPYFLFEVLKLTAGVDFPGVINGLGIDDISETLGPLYEYYWTTTGFQIPLLDKNWSLLGFPEFTMASFEVTPPIPEPATMLLLGSGMIGLGIFGRKRKKSMGRPS